MQRAEVDGTKKAHITTISNIYDSVLSNPKYFQCEEVLNCQRMYEQVLDVEELACRGLQSTEYITGEDGSVAFCYGNEYDNPHCPCQNYKCGLLHQRYFENSCSAAVSNGTKERFSCDNHGTEYHSETHGVHIIFPQGAVPEGVTVIIELDIMLNGPFNFPHNMKVVSPILWVCVVDYPNFQFQKPVTVTLPHFLDISCDSDIELLQPCFMKAGHDLEQAEQLKFRPMDQSEAIYPAQGSSATVKTDHFCYLCIATNAPTPAIRSKTRYYFASWVPKSLGEHQSWDVVFSVSYLLPTCIKVSSNMTCIFFLTNNCTTLAPQAMDEQYSDNHRKHHDIFKFAENSDKLEIDYRNELPGGWQLTLQSSPEVSLHYMLL